MKLHKHTLFLPFLLKRWGKGFSTIKDKNLWQTRTKLEFGKKCKVFVLFTDCALHMSKMVKWLHIIEKMSCWCSPFLPVAYLFSHLTHRKPPYKIKNERKSHYMMSHSWERLAYHLRATLDLCTAHNLKVYCHVIYQQKCNDCEAKPIINKYKLCK